MIHTLAQAIKLPGLNGTPAVILYPPEFQKFVFTGANATLGAIIVKASYFVFAFAGLGLLIMLIMAGFSYLTSAGDAKKLEQGKQQITNAFLGFVIIFIAFWLVQLAGTILGMDTITTMFTN